VKKTLLVPPVVILSRYSQLVMVQRTVTDFIWGKPAKSGSLEVFRKETHQ
jgi:hypothetical protein